MISMRRSPIKISSRFVNGDTLANTIVLFTRNPLVDADVIDIVKLREEGSVIRIARPLTADGRVQDQVMWRMRDARDRCVDELVVHIPANCVRFPFQRINMEVPGLVIVAAPSAGA
jgi:hypothetical protein